MNHEIEISVSGEAGERMAAGLAELLARLGPRTPPTPSWVGLCECDGLIIETAGGEVEHDCPLDVRPVQTETR